MNLAERLGVAAHTQQVVHAPPACAFRKQARQDQQRKKAASGEKRRSQKQTRQDRQRKKAAGGEKRRSQKQAQQDQKAERGRQPARGARILKERRRRGRGKVLVIYPLGAIVIIAAMAALLYSIGYVRFTTDDSLASLGVQFVTPTPGPTAEPSPPTPLPLGGPLDTLQIESDVWTLTNEARARHGLPSLERVGAIDAIARAHSENMAARSFFSHVDPAGQDSTDRALSAGYPCRKPHPDGSESYGLAENIAEHPRVTWWKSSTTLGSGWRPDSWHSHSSMAQEIVDGWMDSPGHRENILDPGYTRIGVGIAVLNKTKDGWPDETVLATQNFC